MRIYSKENEILLLVEAFENGTINREDWRHAEHLTVALFYLSNHDYETAYSKMRQGIFHLLKSFGVDLIKEMPYHETLTVFWLKTVDDFRKSKKGASIIEISNELNAEFDKDYPLRFYSRERLFSEEARANFIEADLL
ncbi:MAG TPA: hypothetical protein PKE69_22430 [Pyrinomonadaceae bacterium]|nr:hypothetical protein [Pyrinomonadaceae bacterium]